MESWNLRGYPVWGTPPPIKLMIPLSVNCGSLPSTPLQTHLAAIWLRLRRASLPTSLKSWGTVPWFSRGTSMQYPWFPNRRQWGSSCSRSSAPLEPWRPLRLKELSSVFVHAISPVQSQHSSAGVSPGRPAWSPLGGSHPHCRVASWDTSLTWCKDVSSVPIPMHYQRDLLPHFIPCHIGPLLLCVYPGGWLTDNHFLAEPRCFDLKVIVPMVSISLYNCPSMWEPDPGPTGLQGMTLSLVLRELQLWLEKWSWHFGAVGKPNKAVNN